MLESDLAWVAGVIEGEGWIGANYQYKPTPRLEVKMTDLDVLNSLARITGVGKVSKAHKSKTNVKQPFIWRVHKADETERLFLALWPWLHQRRRDRIIEVIQDRYEYGKLP